MKVVILADNDTLNAAVLRSRVTTRPRQRDSRVSLGMRVPTMRKNTILARRTNSAGLLLAIAQKSLAATEATRAHRQKCHQPSRFKFARKIIARSNSRADRSARTRFSRIGSTPRNLSRFLRYLPLSPASEATNPASWIWRPSFERQRDFNPPEQRAAQRTLPCGGQSAHNAAVSGRTADFWHELRDPLFSCKIVELGCESA